MIARVTKQVSINAAIAREQIFSTEPRRLHHRWVKFYILLLLCTYVFCSIDNRGEAAFSTLLFKKKNHRLCTRPQSLRVHTEKRESIRCQYRSYICFVGVYVLMMITSKPPWYLYIVKFLNEHIEFEIYFQVKWTLLMNRANIKIWINRDWLLMRKWIYICF